jgi:hypothetical protein
MLWKLVLEILYLKKDTRPTAARPRCHGKILSFKVFKCEIISLSEEIKVVGKLSYDIQLK